MQRQASIATQRSLPCQGRLAFAGAAAVAFATDARHGNTKRQRPMGPLGDEDGNLPGKRGA